MKTPDEKIQELPDKGISESVLLESVLNRILQSELSEHLRAEPEERTDSRWGYRNGSYQRKLTTRVGTLKLEVPRARDGTLQAELFERYQRSEYVPTVVRESASRVGPGLHQPQPEEAHRGRCRWGSGGRLGRSRTGGSLSIRFRIHR